MSKQIMLILVRTSVLLGLLTACGESSKTTPTATTPASTPASQTTVAPAQPQPVQNLKNRLNEAQKSEDNRQKDAEKEGQ